MNKPINAVELIRLPDGLWHDKAFTSFNAAEAERIRLETEVGIKYAEVVTRFNKDNIPVGDDVLVLYHWMMCKINGIIENQVFDTREIYFSIEELMSKSSALRDLKNDLKCEGNPVYYENLSEAPENFIITGPYYRQFSDVGKVEVIIYKLTVKRIKIVREKEE